MSEPRQNTKPTLEEVLRLKRAERPGPEFWMGFERELRQKQLTALVEKRRWWHGLPLVVSRRIYLPVGATAVVAFALVAVRFNSPVRIAGVESTAPRIEAVDPDVEMLPATVVATALQDRYEEPSMSRTYATIAEVTAVPHEAAEAWAENSPSARSIAANLASLEQSEPELVQAVIGNRLSSPARVQAAAMLEPETALSQPAPRYRLIARYADRVLSPKPEAPDLVRQHLARRLGDDLGDDLSRIGLGGDRVSLKF
ncbi:MAG: hypothetical protein QG602_1502 [Verrucomicrobiota bacterium]|nr:hypothetical protein [Verrucomicrobiota bacterium]